jgi:hypothetical protein
MCSCPRRSDLYSDRVNLARTGRRNQAIKNEYCKHAMARLGYTDQEGKALA